MISGRVSHPESTGGLPGALLLSFVLAGCSEASGAAIGAGTELLARDEMAGAKFAKVALVKQRQPRGKQLAIDHALGQAIGNAKADAL